MTSEVELFGVRLRCDRTAYGFVFNDGDMEALFEVMEHATETMDPDAFAAEVKTFADWMGALESTP